MKQDVNESTGRAVDSPGHRRTTDLGNARRLVDRHGELIRYMPEQRSWCTWQENRWIRDWTQHIVLLAKETVESIRDEAELTPDPLLRAELLSHARDSESAPRIRAMIDLAASEPGVPVLAAHLDADRWLLNMANGVLDLRTGELLPHRPQLLLTKLAPVGFDPHAECPLWVRFLERVTEGRNELVGYLQRLVGSGLAGERLEETVAIVYGPGANGKTTFLEVVRAVLGTYAAQADFGLFVQGRHRAIPNDLARLAGMRLVTASEADEEHRLAETMIKNMTGRDPVVARFLFHEFFEFLPGFTLVLATNHLPEVRGTDLAIWRRIHVVPFTAVIPADEQDATLRDKLELELPGILNWALEGCREWQSRGLDPPEEITQATEEFRKDSDVLAPFLAECCVVDPARSVRSEELYPRYVAWCRTAGEKPLSMKALGRRLSERGFQRTRTGSPAKARGWLGLGLRAQKG